MRERPAEQGGETGRTTHEERVESVIAPETHLVQLGRLPGVHGHRPDEGKVHAEAAVLARALEAHEAAQGHGGPLRVLGLHGGYVRTSATDERPNRMAREAHLAVDADLVVRPGLQLAQQLEGLRHREAGRSELGKWWMSAVPNPIHLQSISSEVWKCIGVFENEGDQASKPCSSTAGRRPNGALGRISTCIIRTKMHFTLYTSRIHGKSEHARPLRARKRPPRSVSSPKRTSGCAISREGASFPPNK